MILYKSVLLIEELFNSRALVPNLVRDRMNAGL